MVKYKTSGSFQDPEIEAVFNGVMADLNKAEKQIKRTPKTGMVTKKCLKNIADSLRAQGYNVIGD